MRDPAQVELGASPSGIKSEMLRSGRLYKARAMAKNIARWLSEPVEGPAPTFDLVVLDLVKVCYLCARLSLRAALGKKRRDRIRFARKAWLSKYDSVSYHLLKWACMKFGMSKDRNRLHVLKVRVPQYNYEYYCRIEKGDFTPDRESEIRGFFVPRRGDVVIDVGAHIGRYSMTGSRLVGKEGKVIAIEASPSNYEMLNRNIKLNRLTNVLTVNCAAFSKEATVKLYEPDETASIYNTVMSSRADVNHAKYAEVNASALDSIIGSTGFSTSSIDWIKIDVEGAELEVLKGATQILSACRDISLLVEVHDIRDCNHFGNIVEFLSRFGLTKEREMISPSGTERHAVFRKQGSLQ